MCVYLNLFFAVWCECVKIYASSPPPYPYTCAVNMHIYYAYSCLESFMHIISFDTLMCVCVCVCLHVCACVRVCIHTKTLNMGMDMFSIIYCKCVFPNSTVWIAALAIASMFNSLLNYSFRKPNIYFNKQRSVTVLKC